MLATAELEDSATAASSGADCKLAAIELEESATAAASAAASELATAELGSSTTAIGGRFGTIRTCVGSGVVPYLLSSCRQVHGSYLHTWNL